jgi:hypothetical protein
VLHPVVLYCTHAITLQCSCLDQPSRGFGAFSTFSILYEFYSSQLSVRNLSQDCSSCCVHAACYGSLQLVPIYSLQETYAGSFFPLHYQFTELLQVIKRSFLLQDRTYTYFALLMCCSSSGVTLLIKCITHSHLLNKCYITFYQTTASAPRSNIYTHSFRPYVTYHIADCLGTLERTLERAHVNCVNQSYYTCSIHLTIFQQLLTFRL